MPRSVFSAHLKWLLFTGIDWGAMNDTLNGMGDKRCLLSGRLESHPSRMYAADYVNPEFDWQMFYGAYVKTYIERDVRELTQVGDEIKFLKFMTFTAGCTGQLLNLASAARDVGISAPTAERWLSILVASNIVYLLRHYSNNVLKRALNLFSGHRFGRLSDQMDHAGGAGKRFDGGRFL